MMPLTLSSFGDMFQVEKPGLVKLKGRKSTSSARIVLTAQGSKITNHAEAKKRR